ncbi:unnamed protein product, partial [Staurois parvus]
MVQGYSQQPCTMCQAVTNHSSHSISQWLQECSQREGEMVAFTAFMGVKAISVK